MEIFNNWSYSTATIECSQEAKLWVALNKVIGSVWTFNNKNLIPQKPCKFNSFLNVTTISIQKTVKETFIRSNSINSKRTETIEDITKKFPGKFQTFVTITVEGRKGLAQVIKDFCL